MFLIYFRFPPLICTGLFLPVKSRKSTVIKYTPIPAYAMFFQSWYQLSNKIPLATIVSSIIITERHKKMTSLINLFLSFENISSVNKVNLLQVSYNHYENIKTILT